MCISKTEKRREEEEPEVEEDGFSVKTLAGSYVPPGDRPLLFHVKAPLASRRLKTLVWPYDACLSQPQGMAAQLWPETLKASHKALLPPTPVSHL